MEKAGSGGQKKESCLYNTFIGCENPEADGRRGFLAVRPTRALSSPRLVPE